MAQETLGRLRRQSSMTMGGTALLMVVMQIVLSFLQSAEIANFFNWLILGAAGGAIFAAGMWMFSAQKFWMLSGAILLQTAAAVFFFVVMGVEHSVADGRHMLPVRWSLAIAALPMAGALLAWHQYRSYSQLLRLERSKGRGCKVPALTS